MNFVYLVLLGPVGLASGLKTIESYEEAALRGNVQAQDYLGHAYYEGRGVPQNYTSSAYWFGKASEQGDLKAQGRLAYLFYTGKGG
jgi:TPR repeat protein